MGTTTEKLQRLRQTKADIKAALERKKKNPTNVFQTYAKLIDDIVPLELDKLGDVTADKVLYGEKYSSSEGVGKIGALHLTGAGLSQPWAVNQNKMLPRRGSAYGNGVHVCISSSSSDAATLEYSTDGINWTTANMPAALQWYSVCYGGGKFVAIAYNDNRLAYSADGKNWTLVTQSYMATWTSIAYGNNTFIAIANSGATALYSGDGITWATITLPVSAAWKGIAYGDGKFVIVSFSNVALVGTSLSDWKQITMPDSNFWGVTYGKGRFVAVGTGTQPIYYSTDGETWTAADLAYKPGNNFNTVAYGEGVFVAMISNCKWAMYSLDGANWYQYWHSQNLINFFTLSYGNGKFIAAGASATVLCIPVLVNPTTAAITAEAPVIPYVIATANKQHTMEAEPVDMKETQ